MMRRTLTITGARQAASRPLTKGISMKRTVYFAALAAAIGVLALAAACGGGGGDDNGTATPEATATLDPAAAVTPFPTAVVTGNTALAETKGYSVTFPAGWRPRFNFINTVDSSVDAYFEPLAPDAVVQTSIAVTCVLERLAGPEERIELQKTATSRVGLNKDIVVTERQISGMTATVLTYINTSQQGTQPELSKQDVLFSGEICDYTVTTTAAAGERAQYQAEFDTFLDSFRLLP